MTVKLVILVGIFSVGIFAVLLFAQDDDMRSMIYYEPQPAHEFNPLLIRDRVSLHFSTLIFDNLVERDAQLNLKPKLLESLQPEPEKAKIGIYRFPLKSNVRWFGCDRNGVVPIKKFTAQDVVYTFQEIRNGSGRYGAVAEIFGDVKADGDYTVEFALKPDFSIPITSEELDRGQIRDELRRQMRMKSVRLSPSAKIRHIEPGRLWVITDRQETGSNRKTLTYILRRNTDSAGTCDVLNLSDRDNTFVLSHLQFPIIPDLRDTDTSNLRKFDEQFIVGTGLFAIFEKELDRIKVLNTHQYLEGDPTEGAPDREHIPAIIMKTRTDLHPVFSGFQRAASPELLLMTEIPLQKLSEARNDPNNRIGIQNHSVNRFTYFAYNCQGVFKDDNIRRAFTHAFDREKTFDDLYSKYDSKRDNKPVGFVIHHPLPENRDLRDIPRIEYDPGKAQTLMKEIRRNASDELSAELGRRLKLIAHTETTEEAEICHDFVDALEDVLKIKIRIEELLLGEWLEKIEAGDFDIAFGRLDFNQETNVVNILFGPSSAFCGYTGRFLFHIPSTHRRDLDSGGISRNLRQVFQENRATLSDDVNISIIQRGDKWLIEDLENQKTYALVKEGNELNVFDYRIAWELRNYERAKNPDRLAAIEKRMAQIIAEEVPFTFLYRIPRYAAYRTDVLGGVEIDPYYFFSHIHRWYMRPEKKN
jgi:ABC-type transport system substrate-binding protein